MNRVEPAKRHPAATQSKQRLHRRGIGGTVAHAATHVGIEREVVVLHKHLSLAGHGVGHVVDDHLPASQDGSSHDDCSFSSACFWMACMMAAPAPPISSPRLATAQSLDSTSVRAESWKAGITVDANSS